MPPIIRVVGKRQPSNKLVGSPFEQHVTVAACSGNRGPITGFCATAHRISPRMVVISIADIVNNFRRA